MLKASCFYRLILPAGIFVLFACGYLWHPYSGLRLPVELFVYKNFTLPVPARDSHRSALSIASGTWTKPVSKLPYSNEDASRAELSISTLPGSYRETSRAKQPVPKLPVFYKATPQAEQPVSELPTSDKSASQSTLPNADKNTSELAQRLRHQNTSQPLMPAPQSDATVGKCSALPERFPHNAGFFPCDWRKVFLPPNCRQRLRAYLSCTKSSVDILREWVSVDAAPAAYKFKDECLMRAARERCTEDENLIPRLAHIVNFGQERKMSIFTFLAVLSIVRFVQPCMVLIHGDLFTGTYWDALVRLVPSIVHVTREEPFSIFGKPIKVIQHKSDVARLEAMKEFGGVYFDEDYWVLKPLDDLRKNAVVMGIELPGQTYCNAFFMGKAETEFFKLWYDSYRTFNDKQWAYHSSFMGLILHRKYPNVSLREVDTFFKPHYEVIGKQFYTQRYNWTSLYGIHLYYRSNKKYFADEVLEKNELNLGEITRHILFGDKNACVGK